MSLNSNIGVVDRISDTYTTGSTYGEFNVFFTKKFANTPTIIINPPSGIKAIGFITNQYFRDSNNKIVGVGLQAQYNGDWVKNSKITLTVTAIGTI